MVLCLKCGSINSIFTFTPSATHDRGPSALTVAGECREVRGMFLLSFVSRLLPRIGLRWACLLCLCTGLSMSLGQKKKEEKQGDYPKGAGHQWLEFPAAAGTLPEQVKRVVLVAGEEECRSEESLPVLAACLSRQFGWECRVLLFQNKETGHVDPNEPGYVPNFAALKQANLIILSLRHRELEDKDAAVLNEYLARGAPVLALRHSLAAFSFDAKPNRAHAYLDWQSEAAEWEGGFGARVLGAHWLDNWARRGQATRLLPNILEGKKHPLVESLPETVLTSHVIQPKLHATAEILWRGQVLASLAENAAPVDSPRKSQRMNDPMLPVAWTFPYQIPKGKPGRSVTTTMGAAPDFLKPEFRQFLVNAASWLLGVPTQPLGADSWPQAWKPSPTGFMQFRKKTFPKDLVPS